MQSNKKRSVQKKKTREEKTSELVLFAKQFKGVPYKYGARMQEAPVYFDCSGFVKYIFEHFGYTMPRSTIEQAEFSGRKVRDIKQLQKGDLIFLHGERGHYNKKFPEGIGHVVVFIGEGKVIHATSRRIKEYPNIVEVGGVKIEKLEKVLEKKNPVVVIKRVI